MWGTPVAVNVPASDKLMSAFGANEPVEIGRIYGSVEEGTARVFHQPPVTHPATHFSRRAIGHAIHWFQTTLQGTRPLPPNNQIWFWKEMGNLLALVGMVLLLFPVGRLLLGTRFFGELNGEPTPARGLRGGAWWAAALIFVALPAATLFPFKTLGSAVPVSAFFPQSITNQLMVWALLAGLISAALFAAWHFSSGRKAGGAADRYDRKAGATPDHYGRKAGGAADHYGLTWAGRMSWRKVGKSLLLAFLIALSAYLTLVVSSAVFTVDYRFWVFAVKPMSPLQARIALSYLVPFVLFFAVYGVVLFGQLRRDLSSLQDTAMVVALSTLGFVGLIAFQYVPLFMGGTLAVPSEALWSIIAYQFVPLMTIVGLVTASFQRATGRIYVGAFLSGILVTWIVVAGQPIHYGF
jgi:hypothetical protein